MIPPFSSPLTAPLQPVLRCPDPFLTHFATYWWQCMNPQSRIFWLPEYDNYPTLRIVCGKLPNAKHIKQCLFQLGHISNSYTMANLHRPDSNYERSYAITFPWQPKPTVLLFALAYIHLNKWEYEFQPPQCNYPPYFPIYREWVKNRESFKEAPQVSLPARAVVFIDTPQAREEKTGEKPTPNETDSSLTSGIQPTPSAPPDITSPSSTSSLVPHKESATSQSSTPTIEIIERAPSPPASPASSASIEITSSANTSSLVPHKESAESQSATPPVAMIERAPPTAICVIKSPREILLLGDKNTGVTVQIVDWSEAALLSNEKKVQLAIWILKNHSIDFPILWQQIKTHPKILPKLLPELKLYFEKQSPLTKKLIPLFIECVTQDTSLLLKDLWVQSVSNPSYTPRQELFDAGAIYQYDRKSYADALAKFLQCEPIDLTHYLELILTFISQMENRQQIAEKTLAHLNETNVTKACKNLLPFLQPTSKQKLNELLSPQPPVHHKETKPKNSQTSPLSLEKYLTTLRENLQVRPITNKERKELKSKCKNHTFNEDELKALIEIELFRNYPKPADLEILRPIWNQVLEKKDSHLFWILACFFAAKESVHPPHILQYIQGFAPQIIELINQALNTVKKESEPEVDELDGLITFVFQFHKILEFDKRSFLFFKKNLLTYINTEYAFVLEKERFLHTSAWMLTWLSPEQSKDLTEDEIKIRDRLVIKAYSSLARFAWDGTFENHSDMPPERRSLWTQFVKAFPNLFPKDSLGKIFSDYTEIHASMTSKQGVLVTDQATLLYETVQYLLKSPELLAEHSPITAGVLPILFLRINQVQIYLSCGKKELKGGALATLNEQNEELSILSQRLLLLCLKNKLYQTFEQCFLGSPEQQFDMFIFYLSICIQIESHIDFESLNEFLTYLPTLSQNQKISLDLRQDSHPVSSKSVVVGLSILLAMEKEDAPLLELFSNIMKQFAKTSVVPHLLSSILYATISQITKKSLAGTALPQFLSLLFDANLPKNLLLQNGIDILTPLLASLRENPNFWTEALEAKYQKAKPKDIHCLEELLTANPPDFAAIEAIRQSFKQDIPLEVRQKVAKTGALLLKVATDAMDKAEVDIDIKSCFYFLEFLQKFHKELPEDPSFVDTLRVFAKTVWDSHLGLDPYAVAQWLLSWSVPIEGKGPLLNQVLVHAAIPFWSFNVTLPVFLKSHTDTLLQIVALNEPKSAPLLKPLVDFLALYESINRQIATKQKKKDAITEALHTCTDAMILHLSKMQSKQIDPAEQANFTILFRLLAHTYFETDSPRNTLSKASQFFATCVEKGVFQKLEDLLLLDAGIDPIPLLKIWHFTKAVTNKLSKDPNIPKAFSLTVPDSLEKKDSTVGLIALMFQFEKFDKTAAFNSLRKYLSPFIQKTKENTATDLDFYIFRRLIQQMKPQSISVGQTTFRTNYKAAILFFLCSVQDFPSAEQDLLWATLEKAKQVLGDLWPKELDPQIKKLGKKP